MLTSKIVECVPNFSEGRDMAVVEAIADCFRGVQDVRLLNYEADADYNRVVVTVIGEPEAVSAAVIRAAGVAKERIDMRVHHGQHSRVGATDVVPFIPIRNMTTEEAVTLAKRTASAISEQYGIPTFLYEDAASAPHRQNLAEIRKGQYEGMAEKIKLPEWAPDYGPAERSDSAGVTVVGARMPLIAFNVDLGTPDIEIANAIARKIRYSGGGYRCIKAGGVAVSERNTTQVTMNLTDFTKTAIYQAMEAVRMEAKRYGVNVIGSEIIGLVPMEAMVDTAAYYLGLHGFNMSKVLETALME